MEGALLLYRNWPTWFLFKFGFLKGPEERVMTLRNGLQFSTRFDLNEPGTIDDVFIRNEYFTPLNAIGEGATVLDIGANIGAFSIAAANQAKNVRVISFEPHPETFARLRKNVELNKLENKVIPQNLAVAGRPGTLQLFVHPSISGANTVAPYRENLEFVAQGKTVPVTATTLETVFKTHQIERCDFLKMDCEGSEFEILESVPDELIRKVQHLAMEYHKEPTPLLTRLTKAGFRVTHTPTDSDSGFIYADR